MNRHRMIVVVSAIVLASASARRVAADAAKAQGAAAKVVAAAPAAAAAQAPDLTGDWRLDPKRSDAPSFGPGGQGGPGGPGGSGGEVEGGGRAGMRRGRGGEGGGGEGGGGGRGGWGGGRGRRGEEGPGDARARPARLPDLLHITQTRTMVSFEDTSGHVLREITTVGASADTFAHAPGAQQLSGKWNGAQLVVERAGPRGRKMTETLSLEDGGHSLVVHTKIEAGDSMPAREIKRVYARVAAS